MTATGTFRTLFTDSWRNNESNVYSRKYVQYMFKLFCPVQTDLTELNKINNSRLTWMKITKDIYPQIIFLRYLQFSFIHQTNLWAQQHHYKAQSSSDERQTNGVVTPWCNASHCGSHRVRVELDWRWVFAAADAAVSFHLAAENLPPAVELGVGPVALGLCGGGQPHSAC